MTDKPHNRYSVRRNDNIYWTVFDIFTGQPAIVNDIEMSALEMEEADDLVDLLNAEYIERRKGTTL